MSAERRYTPAEATDGTSVSDDLTQQFLSLCPQLLRYAERKVPGQAEDILQETWIALMAYTTDPKRGFRPDTNIPALIQRIVSNKIADVLRDRYRHPTTSEMHEASLTAHRSAEEEFLARPREIFAAHGITNRRGQEILLHYADGHSYKEIGAMMGLTSTNVRVIKHRVTGKEKPKAPRGKRNS